MKKIIFTALCAALLSVTARAQTNLIDVIQNVELYFKENKQCPTGYKLIYVKCGNVLQPKCIIPETEQNCSMCWEVHWGPCAGKKDGGMWFYNSFERANRVAYMYTSTSCCPWFETADYKIVLNDPKGCLQKPTGYEMASPWTPGFQLQTERIPGLPQLDSIDRIAAKPPVGDTNTKSSNGIDDLLNELLNHSELNLDADTKKAMEQMQKEAKQALAEQPKTNTTTNHTPQQTVEVRGLAGKIQSGEYDPKSNGSSNSASDKNANSTNSKQQNQESYVLFWLRQNNDGYSNQAFIKLNGKLLAIKPNAGKVINECSYAPSCDAKENCDNIGFCVCVLKANLTQKENTWEAEIINGKNKQGSFTAKPGCNIIEIK
jgi:hypothetical protein